MDQRERQQLLQLFVKSEGDTFKITFRHGGAYILKVLSSMHAKEGDDVVADVVETVKNAGEPPEHWTKAAMNFRLCDIKQVERGEECLFTAT